LNQIYVTFKLINGKKIYAVDAFNIVTKQHLMVVVMATMSAGYKWWIVVIDLIAM